MKCFVCVLHCAFCVHVSVCEECVRESQAMLQLNPFSWALLLLTCSGQGFSRFEAAHSQLSAGDVTACCSSLRTRPHHHFWFGGAYLMLYCCMCLRCACRP
jgi:hypothetical protein